MIKNSALYLILFLAAGCSPAWMLSRPEVTVRDLAVKQMSFTGMTLSLTLGVTNPNGVDVTLRRFSYRLYLEKALVAEGELSDPILLPGHQTVYPSVPIPLTWKALQNAGTLFLNPGAVPYRLEGDLTLRVFHSDWNIPIHREGVMAKTPKEPS